ncbi:Proline-rich transmembrane protein 1 [Holothuria leucospilota]|uniref:Proline-rich transmembrane protein 1 n=1 Tax=Holothuria leucospilota TaxID=206669 RepID=A0A9Q1HLY4_HOLLE|nr:Proline-rich transmembrane protein 1 [Holothuria leucospilota]
MADGKCDGRTPLLQSHPTSEATAPPVNQPQAANYHHSPYQNVPPAEHYAYVNQGGHVTSSYATYVSRGAENQGQFSLVQPNDYFPLSVFVTFCCCFPFGLVAILMSLQVRSRFKNNDYEGALKASQSAKVFSILAILCGTILIIGGVAVIVATSVSASVHPEPPDYSSIYDEPTEWNGNKYM